MDTKLSFMMKAVRELLSHNFSVLLHKKTHLNGYGGWFGTDESEEEFVVAMNHDMAFEIFIHEYCHFLQWKNSREMWDASCEHYDTLFDWIENKEMVVSEEDLTKSLQTIISIEHDCESRVLKLIQLNPIENFDKDKYIKAVNSYLWSYHLNKELRQRPKEPIYSERALLNMPNIFHKDVNYYFDKNNMTSEIRQALLVEYETN